MEYLDIVNENNEVIGKEDRNKAHEKHLLHRAVQIIIVSNKNQIVLQLRKSTKKQYPLYWSGSVAGHVSSGETYRACAFKEMNEEIGVEIDLEYVGKFIIDTDIEYEIVSVYFGRSNGPFKFLETEIEKTEYFNVEKLKNEANIMKMTPHCRKALDLVFEKYF